MKAEEIKQILCTTPLFNGVDVLDNFLERFPPQEVNLAQGECYEVKKSLALFVSGKADIVKASENKDAYLKTLNSTSLFGLATLFSDEEIYISTLVAKSNTKLLMFSQEFVTALMNESAKFSFSLVKLLCQKVRYLNSRIDFYTSSGSEGKLLEFLNRNANEEGSVTISMSMLSDTLGIARASLYRAISSIEKRGYIIKEGKKITLLK